MSGVEIVKRILTESHKDEKELLETLYELILIKQKGQQAHLHKNILREEEFHKGLEEISLDRKKEILDANDNKSMVANSINISNFLNYDCELITKFLCWVYERHYGWTEKLSSSDQSQDLAFSVDPSYEESVIQTLENIIAWVENHDHLSYNLLQAFQNSITSTLSLPVVRKQIILSFFHWLKNLSSKYVIVVWKCFLVLKEIITLGLTDVWSAIRKDTASRLSVAVDLLDEDMLESLFLDLVQICSREEPWQATEGAARGIDKILASCKWVSSSATPQVRRENNHKSSTALKLGRIYYDSLPAFMKDNLEIVFFKLFAHQQLSVREVAGKAFSSCLYKSDYKYFMESFDKIICYLKENFTRKNSENNEQHFVNPYEAEGFLNAVLFLIKNIPLPRIAASWLEYWTVFSHYLMHHASTVRQTTSLLFKYILAKHQASLDFLKLVLQSLCARWNTDLDKLTRPLKSTQSKERISVTNKKDRHDISVCWEWREGRLLAYEVILRYLITNNTYYMLSRTHLLAQPQLKGNILGSSMNERQLRNGFGLHKQKSMLQIDKPFEKKKLAKSLTLSNMKISMKELNITGSEQNQSFLQKAKKEQTDKESPFLVPFVPQLELTDIKVTKTTPCNQEDGGEEQDVLEWLNQQNYVSFRNLMKQMLLQTMECLEDQRWELRRMSQQLLNCLCDVIRSYDHWLFEELYNEAFRHPDSTLYYGACCCALNNTKNYLKTKKTISDSPAKYSEDKLKFMKEMIDVYEANAESVITTISTLLPKCRHKETCNVTMQILMLHQLNVKKGGDDGDVVQSGDINGTICTYLQKLYLSTQESPSFMRSPQKSSYKQMLDLICELQSCLQDYCERTDVIYTVLFLPTLIQAISLSMSDSLNVHIMLNCTKVILQKIKMVDAKSHQTTLNSTCSELCSVLEKDDLEAVYLQQICGIILSLREIMRLQFPSDLMEASVRRRKERAENEMENRELYPVAEDTPRPGVRHKGSVSDDRLSFSTASFDSVRCMTESDPDSSSDEDEKPEDEGDTDDLSSDWDWSSGDEDDRDESLVIDSLGKLLEMLNRTHPPPPDIVFTEHTSDILQFAQV